MKKYLSSQSNKALRACGVYKLMKDDVLIYVGSSIDIGRRIAQHKSQGFLIFDWFTFLECEPNERLNLESAVKLSNGIKCDVFSDSVKRKSHQANKTFKGDELMPVFPCEECGKPFVKRVTFKRFCSDMCRVKNHVDKRIAQNLICSPYYLKLAGYKLNPSPTAETP